METLNRSRLSGSIVISRGGIRLPTVCLFMPPFLGSVTVIVVVAVAIASHIITSHLSQLNTEAEDDREQSTLVSV
jgi:hypothetical protein